MKNTTWSSRYYFLLIGVPKMDTWRGCDDLSLCCLFLLRVLVSLQCVGEVLIGLGSLLWTAAEPFLPPQNNDPLFVSSLLVFFFDDCCSLSLVGWSLGVTAPFPLSLHAGVVAISSLLRVRSFPDVLSIIAIKLAGNNSNSSIAPVAKRLVRFLVSMNLVAVRVILRWAFRYIVALRPEIGCSLRCERKHRRRMCLQLI